MKRFKVNVPVAILLAAAFITTATVTEPVEIYAKKHISQGSQLKKISPQEKSIAKAKKLKNGVRPLTKADKQWAKKNMIDAKSAALNEIGLKRVNETRAKKGLKAIDSNKAVKIGDEVISTNSTQLGTKNTNSLVKNNEVQSLSSTDATTLPECVDNTELQYFPAINNQGKIGSCVSFSTTYYQATYMNALAHGWDLKNNPDDSKTFSPRWTYNLINNGQDMGSRQEDAYKLFKEQGIATQKDLPYVGDVDNPTNYLGWSTDSNVWKNATNNKLDKMGCVYINDNGRPTPIEGGYKSTELTTVKQMLNDGYIFSVDIPISNVATGVIKDTASPNDDKYVGQKAIYGTFGSYDHGVTVVGYNDDIWVDMNRDGQMQDSEKGAFKIINSWGNNNSGDNSGVVWISYDALNRGSDVKPQPVYSNKDGTDLEDSVEKFGAFQSDKLYWMTMKSVNTPKLLVQADINTAHRDKLKFKLGYSDDNSRKITWEPQVLNGNDIGLKNDTGDYSFNGTTTASDGTIILDYSNFVPCDLNNTKRKWYLEVTDSSNSATIKGFKFIDTSSSIQDLDPSVCNYQIDGTTVKDYKLDSPKAISSSTSTPTVISMDYGLNSNNKDDGQWNMKKPLLSTLTSFHNMVTYNNKVYTICTDIAYKQITDLLEYDPSSDSWTVLSSEFFDPLNYYIFILNGKIYATERSGGTAHIYDIASKTWSTDSTFSFPAGITDYGLVTLNNNLYIVGGVKDTAAVNTVWEYNPSKNSWTQKASINDAIQSPILSVAKDDSDGKEKLYIIGGRDSSWQLNTKVSKYDPDTGICSQDGLSPYYDWNNVSCNDGKSYAAPVSIGDKIYMSNKTYDVEQLDLYEYSTATKDWVKRDTVLPTSNRLNVIGMQAVSGKIYMMDSDDYNTNLFEFNPSISDAAASRVNVPRCGIPSGIYDQIDPISISCATPGAVIHYTTDGTEPTKDSPIYTGTIAVKGKTTIKAIAMKDGLSDSYVMTASYDLGVNAPRFGIPSDKYEYMQKLSSISCTTPGAVIHYTIDGTDPTESSPIFTENTSITLHDKMTVKAVAIKAGLDNSEIVSATYDTPSFVGDVNGDGKINVLDLMLMQKAVNKNSSNFPDISDGTWAGDLNGDISIDTKDIELMKSYLRGNIKYFPKERPDAPYEVNVISTSASSITLSWPESKAVKVAVVDHYELYRDGVLLNDKITTNNYTDSTVAANTKYSYTVVAVDSEGRKSFSSPAVQVSTN